MNRNLASAVVRAFHSDRAELVREHLAPFPVREWQRTLEWLHTSGLALYLLDRVHALQIEDAVPQIILQGLEANRLENQARTEALFNEFARINCEFQRAKLSYANLKGFTLVPRSCVDPTCRYQHDLDFLVARGDAERCRQAVERMSYRLTAIFGDTWEFKAGCAEVLSMRDLYKARTERSLEVHLVRERESSEGHTHNDLLSRLQLQSWNGLEFPALSEVDKLLAQAQHLFKHFQTEWTRAAWLLEFSTAIHSHKGSPAFWRDVVAAVEARPEAQIGIGMATLVSSRAFACTPPSSFVSCTVDRIPEQVRLWVDHYEQQLIYTEHPGTKLYLLLKDVLLEDQPDWRNQRRSKLLPSRIPPKFIHTTRSQGIGPRTRLAWAHLCFIAARLRFHIAEGLRYKRESMRWKRFVGSQIRRFAIEVGALESKPLERRK